jgi:hypothetical protein
LKQTYQYSPDNHHLSDPNKLKEENLRSEEMIINLGPQHPSTHGVLRLEVLIDGEIVKEVVPHLGYLHRCFEKHAEKLPYNQVIHQQGKDQGEKNCLPVTREYFQEDTGHDNSEFHRRVLLFP